MHITKLGHCCLLVEHNDIYILTDPGVWTAEDVVHIPRIDIVLITHEHADHMHVDSLQAIVSQHPLVTIVTNSAVGALLAAHNLPFTLCEGVGTTCTVAGVTLCAHDAPHEEIYEQMGQVQNTGYRIAEKLVYPGDALPTADALARRGMFAQPVDILALPVAGPWCRIRDSVRFAPAVSPHAAFPVHDGMLVGDRIGSAHGAPAAALAARGIGFVVPVLGEAYEL